ncbi:MAG: YicC family protein [Verrucomicrobia bacterium]|nr:YicC family protein [Verrucomicrobiota bacterium]MBP9903765.1 YicC family protein [Verrucomicrobiota bacterium]
MKSMTGYGRATAALEGYTLTVQVNSVNRKTLDLAIKLPAAWDSLEAGVGELVRKVAQRGRVSVSIELTGARPGSEIAWDEAEIGATLDRLSDLAEARGLRFEPTPELLWSIANSQRQSVELPPADAAATAVTAAVTEALRGFSAMRAKEGEALLIDFISRLETLRRHVDAIAARASVVPAAYREQLLQRLRQAELELDVGDERVLKEIALFADRSDVTEELTRLRSHFDQFAALLRTHGEIGRKAEFILQEIGREVNTIGSKANDLTISRAVIELKNELERIREQIANVE